MRKAIVGICLSIALAAMSQDRMTLIPRSKRTGPGPQWSKGMVEGQTYKNASIGIELTPPPGLELGAPGLKGSPGTVPLSVTIIALGERTLTTARELMTFTADALAYYPENRRSIDDHMRRIVERNGTIGYVATEPNSSEFKLGGVPFARRRFQKGFIYETILAKVCDNQQLMLIFTGASPEAADKLSAATELKLDPAVSGCVLGPKNSHQ